jgi:hypothetical protein
VDPSAEKIVTVAVESPPKPVHNPGDVNVGVVLLVVL